MPDGRCPSCGASVRSGADWCSLCYADLRPAPPPPPPAPAPVPVAVAAAPAAVVDDPLSAPYDAVLGAVLEGTPLAGPTWPCFDCGGANPIDAMVCETCGAAFGARLAGARDETPRRERLVKVLVGLGVFLAVIALVSYVVTPTPPDQPPASDEIVETAP